MAQVNTPAYYNTATITGVKSVADNSKKRLTSILRSKIKILSKG